MAAANESQGLKIAVAAFVTLTVILGVTSYFLYSGLQQSDAKLTAAEDKARNSQKAAGDALTQYDELRKVVGSRAEEYDAVKTEIKNETKKIDDGVKDIEKQVTEAIGKAQGAGAAGPELETAKTNATQLINSYLSEPNKNYISSTSRMLDLLKNQTLLSTSLAVNYLEVKRALEATNGVNKSKLDVETEAVTKAKSDLEAEHTKHEQERARLISEVDQKQTDNAKQATEIANLNTKLRQLDDDFSKKLALAQQTIRDLRERVEKKDNILDRPSGLLTYVDYSRSEVRINVTRSMGARPQMQLTVFDSHSPGIPSEKPKGTVELIQVGERDSVARIVQTVNPLDPFRTGDLIYSPAWSPDKPMRFALIGKMDINRDTHDDRQDLKRMIAAAGGIVDYDLPPPDVATKESGKLTGADDWYVIDERGSLAAPGRRADSEKAENADFLKKVSEAKREARLNGVRPMPIERLLAYLGYTYNSPAARGRTEAIDRSAVRDLLRQRTDVPKAVAAPPAEAPKAKEATPKEETPKEEATKEETTKEEAPK